MQWKDVQNLCKLIEICNLKRKSSSSHVPRGEAKASKIKGFPKEAKFVTLKKKLDQFGLRKKCQCHDKCHFRF